MEASTKARCEEFKLKYKSYQFAYRDLTSCQAAGKVMLILFLIKMTQYSFQFAGSNMDFITKSFVLSLQIFADKLIRLRENEKKNIAKA